MEKTEFLNQLRMSLNGKLEPQDVADNINYYEDYINTQIRMGRPEAEVMEELGPPRLIARTIADANGIAEQEYQENVQERTEEKSSNHIPWAAKILSKFFLLPHWARSLIMVVVVIMVLSLIFTILKALLPAILVVAIVLMMVKFFRELK